jgi:hypothetical protein
MRNAICTVVFGIFLSLMVGAVGRDQFDGKWAVTVTSDDGKTYDDTLTFAGGKFISQKQKSMGFTETEYDADVRGGQAATFTATAKSKKEGSAKWTGTVAATEINGTLEWTKADGSVVNYTYRGSRGEKK